MLPGAHAARPEEHDLGGSAAIVNNNNNDNNNVNNRGLPKSR